MKKSKLYGSRLIEDNELTITPELVTLESTDNVTNLTFDRGNILDAASIKLYLTATSDDLTTKYNTLSENVTTNSNDIITINTLLTTTAESINSINANITTINNSLVDYGVALEYVDNKLILKNKNSDTLSSIDLSIMTENTYLDTVTFSNNKLIFTWNEESSKQPVTIDLSELKDKDGNILRVGNILSLAKDLFISKNDADAAKGIITFLKGIRVGNYTGETGAVIDVDKNSGLTYLEVDKLKVRMKAYFDTLEIVHQLSIAGKQIITPGGSIKCTRVVITDELNYKCYFNNTQDDVKIDNRFAVNDLAISKDYNIQTVEYQSATNHYYWRKVIEVGEDYIVLSKTDCDTGSDIPNVNDVICQLGNTTDTDRLNALIFSAVDEMSPCVNLYAGITSYSLTGKEYVSYGVDKTTDKAFFNVYGDMYFGDRPTADNLYEGASYVKFNSTDKKVTIKGELDVKSTVGGTKIDLYIKNNSLNESDINALINNSTVINDMQNLIDGAIETYFYTGVPTLSNLPTSGWVEVATETNKETYVNHVGDLYYDKDTGKAYRFMKDGNTGIYSWVTITDVDITKALKDSSEALQTANVKRRIFYGTPIPPYDKGDLWVEATYPVGTTKTDAVNNEYYSEILYCNTAKTLGSSFAITDWKLSNNYTKTIGTVITDLNGYKYIKDALLNDTETSGGLILSSLIALRDSSGDIQSGINGILNPEATGKGIATWWGGKMIDGGFTPNITTTTITDYATSLIRFDGSGYLANGNISWDTTGKVHANPLSFFVGPTNIGIISSLFSTIPADATSYSQVTKIHPTKPFDTLTADTITATSFIGELQGNAATVTKLKTPKTIWGQSFDGSGDVNGELYINNGIIRGELGTKSLDGVPFHGVIMGHKDYNKWDFGECGGQYNFYLSNSTTANASLIARIDTDNNYLSGRLGIGTISPAYKLDVNGNARIASDLYADATVGTRNFASRTTGWRADANGNADFRNIYADELRVQAFTADISQALAGSDYLTKSVSKLSANFVVPSVNSTVRIIVDDIEGMPATQCFANGDYIRFRAFNRTSGLTIANVWGTVVLDTTFGTNGFLNGTQAYTFTCKQTSGAGLTVFKGSEVLDYGTSGSGMISRTTLDDMGSPYEQIATWVTDPSNGNNYTVHARLGDLGGIANCNGYGLYTDNGFFTGKIVIGDLTKNANFLSFDTVNGLQIKLGGTSVATTTDVSNSLTTANTNAQGYANTAQSNASLDATTKANTAYSNAVTYTNTQITATNNSITAAVNGIQVGGTNLLLNTRNWTNTNHWYDNGNGGFSIDSSILYLGSPTLKALGIEGIRGDEYRVEENTYYTYSAMLYASDSIYVDGDSPLHKWVYNIAGSGVGIHNESNQTVNISSIPAKTWTLVSVTFLVPSGNTHIIPFFYGWTSWVQLNIAYIKLEKGNKATSWSPAPEDVDASISTAQSTAISTAASNAAALYVTSTAYNAYVSITNQAISSKVAQTDFNALNQTVGQHATAISQNAQDITSKVSSTDYNGNQIASLINQTATTIQIQASKINLVGAVTFSSFDSSTQNTISNKADTSTVNTQVTNAIGTAATDATNKVNAAIGLNKWILKKYSYSTTSGMIPTFALINNLIPDFTEEKDDALKFSASPDNNSYERYIGIVTTYLYCNADYTYIASNISHDDGGSIYVNGSLVYSNGFCSSSNSVSLPFKKGWNRIDLLWAEENGDDYFSISHLFSQDSNITKMAAYPNADTINPYSIAYANATQSAAQTYATTNCVQVGLSNAPDDIKNQVLAAAHGNFTYINGSSVYTGTLNANQVTAGYISADRIDSVSVVAKGITAQTVQAATLQTIHNSGEAYIDIQKGIIDVYGTVARNIQFGVNEQGMAVLKYFDNDGVNLYDLGPNGIDAKNLQSAQWEEIQYVQVLSIMQTVPPEGLISDDNASALYKLFRLNTAWDLTTLYRYHAGKINNTIVSDSANGFKTAAEAAAADGKIFTVSHAGYLANDTYTKNNGSSMFTDNISKVVVKDYWVIQNGVQTSYDWECPLDTFNMINGIEPSLPVQGPGGGIIQ